MTEALSQYILGGGLVTAIITITVTCVINQRFDAMEQHREDQMHLEKLMITKTDELSELVELMACKLHEKGIINGDLERLRTSYAQVDKEYDDYLRELVVKERK